MGLYGNFAAYCTIHWCKSFASTLAVRKLETFGDTQHRYKLFLQKVHRNISYASGDLKR